MINYAIMKSIKLLPVVLFVLTSCIGKITPGAREVSIYPGECLSSTRLGYVAHHKWVLSYDDNRPMGLEIGFKMYWDVTSDILERELYRIIPSKDVYNTFGTDSRRVKKAYNDIFDAYYATANPNLGITSTIYYCGGMVMTADKTFAGVPAGDNLAEVAILSIPNDKYNNVSRYGYTPIPTIDVPEGYAIIGKAIGIYFPIDDYVLVDGEEVTFRLEIPVKVGLLLTLLRDRLTNPDAQMQYRDEVLTCYFTINHGLH